MCGRYVSVSSPDRLALQFEVAEVRTGSLGERYNVAPSLDVYAVVAHRGRRRLGALRWGLVPPWASGPGDGPTPINARLETIMERRLFAPAFAGQRCLIPADGFYEWQVSPSGRRPYYVHDPDRRPLAFAGIWHRWRSPDADTSLSSCAIVTTAAAGRMADLHERMPVVLPPALWDDWLTGAPDDAADLRAQVAALDAPPLSAYEVTPRVNQVRNEGPALLTPADDPPPTLF